MKKSTILTISLLIFTTFTFARGQAGSRKGSITDGGDQKIIDAATVSLFKAKDSVLVKINLADKEGHFVFDQVPPGKYYLLATSTGHLKTYSPVLTVKDASEVSAGVLKFKRQCQNGS